MKNKIRNKILSHILTVVMVVTMIGFMPISTYAIEDPIKIYVDSISGSDDNDGSTDILAVKTLAEAFTLASLPGGNYQFIMADGYYPSPGLVNIPAGTNISITSVNTSSIVNVYKNPATPAANRLFEFNSSAFSSITFDNITFTGDNPETTDLLENLGEGFYFYSCDKIGGNVIEFKNCIVENLQSGINQQYSDYLSVIVNDCHITADSPIQMEYGKNLTVNNSVLEMSDGESWNSVVNLNGGTIDVQIKNSTLTGNNGMGRGIYEDVYSGTISGNIFKDLSVAVEANDMYSVLISDNTIETSGKGLDLETYYSTCSISAINNIIVNKGLKTAGAVGIELDSDSNTLTGSFIVQDNKIINFYTGLDYTDYYTSDMSFTLGGVGHGNRFWGNVLNIEWYSYIDTLVEAYGNDWGTNSTQEVYDRIHANGSIPSSIFIFDDTITSDMISTAYVDDDYSPGDAGGHIFGLDAFSSIIDAQPYVASGGEILVENGSYIAPVWIDRPVQIIGQSDNVNLTRHSSLTEYGNTTTVITSPHVTLEQLNFRDGDIGLYFNAFSRYSYSSYPDSYKILNCNFTDFSQTAIYEPGYTISGYETILGSTSEVRDNKITRTTESPQGHGVYLQNQSENLYFSGNTMSGDYGYGFNLTGKNIYATSNNVTVYSPYGDSAFSILNTGNLECTDNVISNAAIYTNGQSSSGLVLYFSDTEGPSVKELYRNDILGFNSAVRIFGDELVELFDITIGGTTSNSNDFSGNEFGLTSCLFNFASEYTNATYNIWGVPDNQLANYIQDFNDSSYYGPVNYLPSASASLSNDATLSGLSASGISLAPIFNTASTSYTASVPNRVSHTTVTAFTTHSDAEVMINGVTGTTLTIDLATGNNIIEVVVTAEDQVSVKTYTLNITRASSGSSSGGSTYTPPLVEETPEQIGNNPVAFSDVSVNSWYKKAIDFIVARGIASGTGDNKFSPDAKLTRGQFVVFLMNSYQLTTQNQGEFGELLNFKDAGNTYYTQHLMVAKGLGIINGVGNNMFAPEKEITRQEMFVMIYNALKVMDEVPAETVGKELSSFNDANEVATWANVAFADLVKAGIIRGSNNNLNPTSTATRAEIAQVLYNLLSE